MVTHSGCQGHQPGSEFVQNGDKPAGFSLLKYLCSMAVIEKYT
jgi:hypothetical protein